MSEKRCFGCMLYKRNSPICEHCGYDERKTNAPHQLSPGTVLNNQYLVGRVLGQGGFGITYMGWDLFLGIPVAIKEFYPSGLVIRDSTRSSSVFLTSDKVSDRFVANRDRFVREATSLARLGRFSGTGSIVSIHNLVQANATAYIIMEYVDGIDMRAYMHRMGGTLTLEETLRLLLPLMESLEIVHGHHIVHRDISPDNIMVLPDGSTKLIDFGAAHEVQYGDEGNQKSTEAILKYGFAPPEQYQRKGALGPWTDVYALCATIYYCTTGKLPPNATDRFMGDEDFEWDTIPGISPDMVKALQKGTAIRKNDRTQSMAQLRQELSKGLCAPTVPSVPDTPVEIPGNEDFAIPSAEEATQKTVFITTPVEERILETVFITAPVEERILETVFVTDSAEEAPAEVPEEEPVEEPEEEPEEVPVEEPEVEPEEVPEEEPAEEPVEESEEEPEVEPEEESVEVPVEVPMDIPEKVPAEAEFSEELPVVPGRKKPALRGKVLAASMLAVAVLAAGILLTRTPREKTTLSQPPAATQATETTVPTIPATDPATEPATEPPTEPTVDPSLWMDNVLMHTYDGVDFSGAYANIVNGYTGRRVYRSQLRNDQIRSITFLDTLESEPTDSWDVSAEKNGTVKAWAKKNGDLYDLYIAAEGGINGSEATQKMFLFFQQLERIQFGGAFHTEDSVNMEGMFRECNALTQVDATWLDTANVTNMAYMFDMCNSLPQLDLGSFDTSSVTNMNAMFSNCHSLTQLDVSSFDTTQAENMDHMFLGCSALPELDVSNFQTPNLSSVTNMFFGCRSLTRLDLRGFNTAKVSDMSGMFSGCMSLAEVDVSSFDTRNVTSMVEMFRDCSSLTTLNLRSFFTPILTDCTRMFYGCTNLTTIDMRNFVGTDLHSFKYVLTYVDIFRGCTNLTDTNNRMFNEHLESY